MALQNPAAAVSIDVGGGITDRPNSVDYDGGTIAATGILEIEDGVELSNRATFTLNNSGTINNLSGGTLTNSGTLSNSGILYNRGTLENSHIFYNYISGILYNSGIFNNYSTGTLTNSGTLSNLSGGTLNNYQGGTLENRGNLDNSGTLTNSGTLSLKGGSFTNSAILKSSGGQIRFGHDVDYTMGGTFNWNGGTLFVGFNGENFAKNGDKGLNLSGMTFESVALNSGANAQGLGIFLDKAPASFTSLAAPKEVVFMTLPASAATATIGSTTFFKTYIEGLTVQNEIPFLEVQGYPKVQEERDGAGAVTGNYLVKLTLSPTGTSTGVVETSTAETLTRTVSMVASSMWSNSMMSGGQMRSGSSGGAPSGAADGAAFSFSEPRITGRKYRKIASRFRQSQVGGDTQGVYGDLATAMAEANYKVVLRKHNKSLWLIPFGAATQNTLGGLGKGFSARQAGVMVGHNRTIKAGFFSVFAGVGGGKTNFKTSPQSRIKTRSLVAGTGLRKEWQLGEGHGSSSQNQRENKTGNNLRQALLDWEGYLIGTMDRNQQTRYGSPTPSQSYVALSKYTFWSVTLRNEVGLTKPLPFGSNAPNQNRAGTPEWTYRPFVGVEAGLSCRNKFQEKNAGPNNQYGQKYKSQNFKQGQIWTGVGLTKNFMGETHHGFVELRYSAGLKAGNTKISTTAYGIQNNHLSVGVSKSDKVVHYLDLQGNMQTGSFQLTPSLNVALQRKQRVVSGAIKCQYNF